MEQLENQSLKREVAGPAGKALHVNAHRHTTETVTTAFPSTHKRRALVVFFEDYYFRFITHRWWRWVVLVALTALVGRFALAASQLRLDNKRV